MLISEANGQQFPYGAKVTVGSAAIRSGPGAHYYHTDRLPKGTRVEVYRHDKDWAAIRPPPGSYSWVPSSAIEMTAGTSLGNVVTDGVRTRIGSRFGDDHTAAYVALQTDELVEVIGKRTLNDDGKLTVWYQIKPPAGEFRWVKLSSIEPLPDALARFRDESLKQDGEVQLLQHLEEPPQLLSLDETISAASGGSDAASPETDESWTLDTTPAGETKSILATNATAESTPDDDTVERSSPPARLGFAPIENDVAARTEFPRTTSTDPALLRRELAKINLELTRQIVREPTTWDLSELRARTQAVIDLGSTDDLRGQGQTLLSRITQFEDLQRRHRSIVRGNVGSLWNRTDRLAGIPSEPQLDFGRAFGTFPPPASAVQSQTAGSAYDGLGWLMPIVTRQTGLPRYALTDDQGNILQFVSPRPGLNLRNYERRRIAVIGRKGFVPRFNKSHVTAERIISLDRVRY